MHILSIGTLGLLEISTASLACVAVADMSPFLSGSSIPGLTGSILRGWESCGCTGYACRRWAGILKAGLWMNRELSMVAGTPRSFTKEVSSAMLVPVAGERSSSHALLSHLWRGPKPWENDACRCRLQFTAVKVLWGVRKTVQPVSWLFVKL